MAILTFPKLDLAPGPETIAFRCVESILRDDPVLKRVISKNGWYSWLGDAQDDSDATLSSCPWIRLTPQAGDSDWESENQHRSPLLVGIELAVAGTNADQLMNLWHAVRRALFPLDVAALQAIRDRADAAKITKSRISRPAFGIRKDDAGNKFGIAGGVLELLLLVDT
jgi:hypothetical protein